MVQIQRLNVSLSQGCRGQIKRDHTKPFPNAVQGEPGRRFLYISEKEYACERQDEARRLRRLIEGLPARERKLILLRYGLAGQPPLTQLETAQLLQISRSYVSRLETHALEQLRKGWLQESPGE